MDEFKGSPTSLVADVDCTAGGKDLCSTHGVRGYPTIKYGDPADLQDYKGGREYKDLDTFAQRSAPCAPLATWSSATTRRRPRSRSSRPSHQLSVKRRSRPRK